MLYFKLTTLLFLIISCYSHAARTQPCHHRVLICGVCKNTEKAAPNTIANIEKLGSRFDDYAVIIYENNSTDNTPSLFSNWAARNPRVKFISENLPENQLSTFREVNIANARNVVLSVAKQPMYSEYDLLIMADLDFTDNWPIEEIIDSIQLPIQWDCISANGIFNSSKGIYYDRYAYRSQEYPLGDELVGDVWWALLRNSLFSLSRSNHLERVYSAFGGLAIYKTDVITKYQYSGTVNDTLSAYYNLIISKTSKLNPQLEHYLSRLTKIEKTKPLQIPIIYAHSQCCEHITLHAAMAIDGHDKFFINPKMIMNYKFHEHSHRRKKSKH